MALEAFPQYTESFSSERRPPPSYGGGGRLYVGSGLAKVAPKGFLHQHGQRVHAATHIGVAGRNPHPDGGRNGDHRGRPFASASTAALSVAASTVPVIRIRAPAANSISIDPPPGGRAGPGDGPDSAATIAGTKPV